MREIKFRAWDKLKNEMIQFQTNQELFNRVGMDYGSSNLRFELMQFTGLNDKNGKEIYEGDIIKDGDFIMKIEYIEKYARFCPIHIGLGTHSLFPPDKNCRIIGNIYEHSHLLSGGQQ